jgi:hypothetical protein
VLQADSASSKIHPALFHARSSLSMRLIAATHCDHALQPFWRNARGRWRKKASARRDAHHRFRLFDQAHAHQMKTHSNAPARRSLILYFSEMDML